MYRFAKWSEHYTHKTDIIRYRLFLKCISKLHKFIYKVKSFCNRYAFLFLFSVFQGCIFWKYTWVKTDGRKQGDVHIFVLSQVLYSHNYIHIQLYTCTSGKIVNTIMTNEHTSLGKYTSHTLFERVAKGLRKGYVWEVSLILNKLQHIDPLFLCL